MRFILWLNDLPLWASAFVLGGGALGLSLGGMALTRGFFSEEQLQANNFLGGFQYLVISNVFAGFLTFLLYGVYQRYDAVRADIVEEVSALESLNQLAVGFSPATRDAVRRTLRQYAEHVVAVEWPQLSERRADALSAAPLTTLYYTFAAIVPASKKQAEVLDVTGDLLETIQDMRAVRFQRGTGSLQPLLWAATLSATLVAIVFPWVFGSPNPNAVALMSVLSIALTISVLIVVLKLSYPFGGSNGISPSQYLAFIDEVRGRGG